MAIVRVRREGPRTLSAAEQRWLLDQVLQQRTSRQAAGRAPEAVATADTAKEASSMIERPTSTALDPAPVVRAKRRSSAATGLAAALAPIDPTVEPIAPRSSEHSELSERSAEATAVPARTIEPGSEPSAVPAAPGPSVRESVRTAEPPEGLTLTRSPTRSADRAAPVVEHTKYRAVFACCCDQARGAPTE